MELWSTSQPQGAAAACPHPPLGLGVPFACEVLLGPSAAVGDVLSDLPLNPKVCSCALGAPRVKTLGMAKETHRASTRVRNETVFVSMLVADVASSVGTDTALIPDDASVPNSYSLHLRNLSPNNFQQHNTTQPTDACKSSDVRKCNCKARARC